MIFLDHAATSLLKPPSVERAMQRAIRSMASPGRGGYAQAREAAETVFRCREAAADLFHMSDPSKVVFTMNATHALNLAIRSLLHPGSNVVISGFEHNAVTRPIHALEANIQVAGRKVFDRDDTIRDFAAKLPGCDAAVCTAVSNVFGYRLPIEEIAALCRREGVPLIIDASQAAGVLDLDFPALGAAFMAMPGHKGLLGPQGTGILLCHNEAQPLLFGGSGFDSRSQSMPEDLPERLEAGTANVCGIAGLLAGIQYVRNVTTDNILRYERILLQESTAVLRGSDCELFLGTPECQCGVLSLRSERRDCEELAALLAEKEICTRAGLHCAPLAHESVGTLQCGTLRLSFSPFLKRESVRRACMILRDLLTDLKTNS